MTKDDIDALIVLIGIVAGNAIWLLIVWVVWM